ncbi:MAG: hypothetical protein ACE5PV_25785 [Candidatus Poribacteria bacterium]
MTDVVTELKNIHRTDDVNKTTNYPISGSKKGPSFDKFQAAYREVTGYNMSSLRKRRDVNLDLQNLSYKLGGYS